MLPQNACEDANLVANVFTGSIPGTTFSWANGNQDVGFGMAGNGQIGGFTAVPGQADITVTPYGPNPTAASPLGCVGPTESFTIIVSPNPVIDFSADVRSGCEPLTVTFTNNTPNSSGCVWLFGDGSTVNGCGMVSNTYAAGLYDVTLTVYSAQGCATSLTELEYIEVFSNPVASFNYAPQEITVEDPIVEFTNTSFNADSYDWNFGDGLNTSVQQDPIHEFPIIPGNYMVTLWAYNNGGQCADMYQQLITIQDVLIYYVPNVFTPDGDDYNETFQPIFTSGFDRYDWHMTIFNRWGEIIFESYDDQKGWNGHYGDGGLVEDGVYIWQIEFKESQVDKLYELRGHVTVLK
jgi:gliding motility-associated-like protein